MHQTLIPKPLKLLVRACLTTQRLATYTHHCWLSDGRLAVASDDKVLQLTDATEVVLRQPIDKGIACMAALPGDGLVVCMPQV